MRYFTCILILLFLLGSCQSGQKKQTGPGTALEHFEKGSAMMMDGLRTEFDQPDSSRYYYQQALDQFLAAYRSDSSLMEVAIYLPDVYFKLGKHDSAAYWNKRLNSESTQP
jgi:hypothetical protein